MSKAHYQSDIDKLNAEIAELKNSIDTLAQQALFVMQVDLGYNPDEFIPRNGHHPIYHQLLWSYATDGLADEQWKVDSSRRLWPKPFVTLCEENDHVFINHCLDAKRGIIDE